MLPPCIQCIMSFIILVLLAPLLAGGQGACVDYPIYNANTTTIGHKAASKVFRIGVFGTYTTLPPAIPLMNYAAQYLNNQTSILPDVLLEMYLVFF